MMVRSNNLREHIIDVNELVCSLTRGTSTLPDEITNNNISLPIIHRFKRELRMCDRGKEIYEPKLVSIGPYHHGSSAIRDMQKAKYVYLDYILLLENQIPFAIVEKIYQVLVGMIDATTLLRKNIVEVTSDMLRFYPKETRQVSQPEEFCHLLHLCHMFFKPHRLRDSCQKDLNNSNNHSKLQIPHYSLRLRSKFLRGGNQLVGSPDIESGSLTTHVSKIFWQQATQYQAAKIEFRKKEISSDDRYYGLLDIGFHSATMEILSLTIDQRTYCLLRNLVAFEQACPQFGNYITDYVVFWSQLITTRDDAELLAEKGILINQMQSDSELVQILSSLTENVTFDPECDCYLKPVCHMVEQQYQHQRPRWRELFGKFSYNNIYA